MSALIFVLFIRVLKRKSYGSSYSCPDLVHSQHDRGWMHQIGLSVCIIHDVPLLSGQLFSIRIPDEVQSGLH